MHLGLMLDTSGSMEADLKLARSAAIKFLNLLPEAEDITLVDFDTEVRVTRYPQRDFARLVERIRQRKPDGWTALYDALGDYLDGAGQQDGRKVLVMYTDGGDTRSALSFSETLTLLKASQVTVYAVGLVENTGSARDATADDAAADGRDHRRAGVLPDRDEGPRERLRKGAGRDQRPVPPRLRLDQCRHRRRVAQGRDQTQARPTCACARARATSRPTGQAS